VHNPVDTAYDFKRLACMSVTKMAEDDIKRRERRKSTHVFKLFLNALKLVTSRKSLR
jgi:hypothetical protein